MLRETRVLNGHCFHLLHCIIDLTYDQTLLLACVYRCRHVRGRSCYGLNRSRLELFLECRCHLIQIADRLQQQSSGYRTNVIALRLISQILHR